jgi:hypothetical protein
MNENVDQDRYWAQVAAVVAGREVDSELIWELQAKNRERIFGGDWPTIEERIDIEGDDPRVQAPTTVYKPSL